MQDERIHLAHLCLDEPQRAGLFRGIPQSLRTYRGGILKTPKYAAIDIIMWLMFTDPDVLALKPGTLMGHILDGDDDHYRQLLEVPHHSQR